VKLGTLARARFDVASSLLADPEQQIIDIASRLGYSDPANFSRAFRRYAGVSPRDYRLALGPERRRGACPGSPSLLIRAPKSGARPGSPRPTNRYGAK
jgi:AraC-like DNA-binding protein